MRLLIDEVLKRLTAHFLCVSNRGTQAGSMLASLKTIYTAFSFLKSERVSTSLQRTDQQKRVDQIASTFLNTEFAAIAQITDVSEGPKPQKARPAQLRVSAFLKARGGRRSLHLHLKLIGTEHLPSPLLRPALFGKSKPLL